MAIIEGLVTTDSQSATGSVVYWQLSGVVELKKLRGAWLTAGLDEADLPPATSPKTALRRAMEALTDGQRVMLKNGSSPEWVGLYERIVENGKPKYVLQFEARLNSSDMFGDPVLQDATGQPVGEDSRDAVEIGFSKELRSIHHHDLSGWLVSAVRKHEAVSLRESGGFYFVPRTSLDRWRVMTKAIESVTKCAFWELPAMGSKQAAEAILDALTREVSEYVGGIDEQIGKVGVRALASREREVERYEARIATYEGILGGKLDALRVKMGELGGRLAMAKLANTADDE